MARRNSEETEQTEATENGAHEQENGSGLAPDSLIAELRSAVRDAAMEVFGPAARQATSSAAKYAVKKGPELMKDNIMPALEKQGGAGPMAQQALSKGGEALSGAGGVAGAAGKLASKLGGGGGGGGASGWGRNRRMPVQQWIYVSVPLKQAYTAWTEYKQWPSYMHRANQVDPQIDDEQVRLKVTEKMWGFTRPFTAEVVCQRPDELIRWNSTEGSKHTGVINFHELAPRLTLIEVNLDHSPSGMIEKISRGARFTKRAVRADLHRFQAWVEMKSDDELSDMEGWRGRIEGGQVVQSHEDAMEEEERSADEGQSEDRSDGASQDEFDEPEGEEDEEFDGPQAESAEDSDEPEAEDEDFDEPEAESDEDDFDEPEAEDEDFDEPEAEDEEDFDEPEAEDEEDFDEPDEDEPEQDEEPEEDEEPEPQPQRRRSRSGSASSSRTPRRRQRTASAH